MLGVYMEVNRLQEIVASREFHTVDGTGRLAFTIERRSLLMNLSYIQGDIAMFIEVLNNLPDWPRPLHQSEKD